jgi:hypothetical protein
MSSTKLRHPRVLSRTIGLLEDAPIDVVIYAPDATVRTWIEGEVAPTRAVTKIVTAVPAIITALVHEPAPRPRLLLVHVDQMAARELRALRELRDSAWTGTIIAIGDHGVPLPLRIELGIEHVVRAPFAPDQLREIVAKLLPSAESSIYKRATVPIEPLEDPEHDVRGEVTLVVDYDA